jgi:hypothetical protein
VDATVDRVSAAGEEAVGLHRVEVMGERGFAYPYGFGDLALARDAAGLEIEEDQPYRQRSSSLSQRLIERAIDNSGGASDDASLSGREQRDLVLARQRGHPSPQN